jgi:hypothetical protein
LFEYDEKFGIRCRVHPFVCLELLWDVRKRNLSASLFVDSFAAVRRFFYLPKLV